MLPKQELNAGLVLTLHAFTECYVTARKTYVVAKMWHGFRYSHVEVLHCNNIHLAILESGLQYCDE